MRISDWSSDVCSSDLIRLVPLIAVLLSGCAVGDALGTGMSAIGDGAKYLAGQVSEPEAQPQPAGQAPASPAPAAVAAIGRASCRVRVGTDGEVSVVAV